MSSPKSEELLSHSSPTKNSIFQQFCCCCFSISVVKSLIPLFITTFIHQLSCVCLYYQGNHLSEVWLRNDGLFYTTMPILHFVLQPTYLWLFGAAFHRLQLLEVGQRKAKLRQFNCLKYICMVLTTARSIIFLMQLKSSVILWLDELVYDDALFRTIPIMYALLEWYFHLTNLLSIAKTPICQRCGTNEAVVLEQRSTFAYLFPTFCRGSKGYCLKCQGIDKEVEQRLLV